MVVNSLHKFKYPDFVLKASALFYTAADPPPVNHKSYKY